MDLARYMHKGALQMHTFGACSRALWGLLLGLWALEASAQSADQTLQRIEEALREGDADRLAPFFAPQVDIFLQGSARVYSSTQARYVLQEFFQNHPPRTFTLLHKGRSEDVVYAIGSYVSTNGRWDVSLFTRFQKGKYLIEQLRLEPPEN